MDGCTHLRYSLFQQCWYGLQPGTKKKTEQSTECRFCLSKMWQLREESKKPTKSVSGLSLQERSSDDVHHEAAKTIRFWCTDFGAVCSQQSWLVIYCKHEGHQQKLCKWGLTTPPGQREQRKTAGHRMLILLVTVINIYNTSKHTNLGS